MKLMKRKLSVLIGMAALVMTVMSQPVQAQDMKIAIIDMQRIMSESKAAKSIQKQLREQREEFQKEISGKEKELSSRQQELVSAQKDMETDAFAAEKAAFEKDFLETRRMAQQRHNALEKAAGEALNELKQEVTDVVRDISEEEGYGLVMTRQNVILAHKGLEATDQVIKALNKSVKKIELDVETN